MAACLAGVSQAARVAPLAAPARRSSFAAPAPTRRALRAAPPALRAARGVRTSAGMQFIKDALMGGCAPPAAPKEGS